MALALRYGRYASQYGADAEVQTAEVRRDPKFVFQFLESMYFGEAPYFCGSVSTSAIAPYFSDSASTSQSRVSSFS
jgi:hypothetical protein